MLYFTSAACSERETNMWVEYKKKKNSKWKKEEISDERHENNEEEYEE